MFLRVSYNRKLYGLTSADKLSGKGTSGYKHQYANFPVIRGSLPPRHGASSCWVRRNILQVRRLAANILNKQSRTADKGWSCRLGVGRGANYSSPYKLTHVTKFSQGFGLGLIFGGKETWNLAHWMGPDGTRPLGGSKRS